MRRIVYTSNHLGSVSIVTPIINSDEFITEVEAEARALEGLPESALNPFFIEESDIPTDRTFRDAWEVESGKIIVSMAKAKDCKKTTFRIERLPLFQELDIEYIRACEENDENKKESIREKKQKLRDCLKSKLIEDAQTPEQLKSLTLASILQG